MSPLDIARRGQIHRLPPSAVPFQQDVDAHWYVLLGSDRVASQDLFMFGTSGVTDCSDGAPCFECAPAPAGPIGTGLRKLTHFNGCALARSHALVGNLGKMGELPATLHRDVRDVVREGIGLGAGLPIGSCRGRLVQLSKPATKQLATRYGVLLTSPPYSRRRRYGVIIPLIDNARTVSVVPPHWVYLSAPWGPSVTEKQQTTGFYAVPSEVVSIYHGRHVDRVCAAMLSDKQMGELEARVASYLVL